MASVLACVWQLHHLMLTLVDTPCPVLTQAGATDPPPRRSPTGGCLVPAPDGSLWPVGGSGLAGAAPPSVAAAAQGTCSRCESCGPDPGPRVRLWQARISVVTSPPGADRSSRATCPPVGRPRGVRPETPLPVAPVPGPGPPGFLVVTPFLGVRAATPPGRLLPGCPCPG